MSQNAPPTPPTDPPAPDDQAPPGQEPRPPGPITDLPTALKALRDTRREAGAYRVERNALREQLAAVDPDGGLSTSIASLKAENRELKIGKAILGAAHRAGIEDPEELEWHLTKSGALKALDIEAATFTDELDSAVEELLVDRPNLRGRSAGAPPTTGAHFRPGPPTSQLSHADLQRMRPEEIADAQSRGLLDHILGRRG